MPGTNGLRKVRVPRAGMGKRGGARVIYLVRRENRPVYLITAYAKGPKENLTRREQNDLARLADEVFNN